MKVIPTNLPGVVVIEPHVYKDERGFFLEVYQEERYSECLGMQVKFVQDNCSYSRKGVLRGLHFQLNKPQGKLVRVVSGSVYDVVVDINPASPDFGNYTANLLSEDDQRQVWIPPGYAHGFLALSDGVRFEYRCTEYYNPNDEYSLAWNDEQVNIAWPVISPILSNKDRNALSLIDVKRKYLAKQNESLSYR